MLPKFIWLTTMIPSNYIWYDLLVLKKDIVFLQNKISEKWDIKLIAVDRREHLGLSILADKCHAMKDICI